LKFLIVINGIKLTNSVLNKMNTKILISLVGVAALSGCAGFHDTVEKFSAVDGNIARLEQSHKREVESREREVARLDQNHQREIARLNQAHTALEKAHNADVARLNVEVKEATRLGESKFAYVATPKVTDIQFATLSAKLSADDEKVLADLAKNLLSENKNVHLELKGQTDIFGSERQNKELAIKRAEAVRMVLNLNGVALNRMALIALPASSTGAVSKTAEDHARNRRVSITVVE
jgi:outer membrane protein OmpA-like peptidoglycan-associated protein